MLQSRRHCQIRQSFTSYKDYWDVRKDYVKIIASMDPKLELPDLPQWYIKEYCEVNGKNDFDKITIEFEEILIINN